MLGNSLQDEPQHPKREEAIAYQQENPGNQPGMKWRMPENAQRHHSLRISVCIRNKSHGTHHRAESQKHKSNHHDLPD